MTNEEALDLMDNVRGMFDDDEYNEAFKIMFREFKKQIPKKVIKSDGLYEIGYCPSCHESIRDRTTYISSVGEITKSYCPVCGQVIDWEVEE